MYPLWIYQAKQNQNCKTWKFFSVSIYFVFGKAEIFAFHSLDTRNIGFLSFCPTVRTMRQIWHSCPHSTCTGCGMCTCWLQCSTPRIWRSLLWRESSITNPESSSEMRPYANENRHPPSGAIFSLKSLLKKILKQFSKIEMSSSHRVATIFYLRQQDRTYFTIRWETNLYNGMLSRTTDVWELYFQVSLPHYTTRTFLRAAITRYAQFLFLKLKNPDAFLVPCYDIDLVWHTHQVLSPELKHDQVQNVGTLETIELQYFDLFSD